jgi:hypothetical protein
MARILPREQAAGNSSTGKVATADSCPTLLATKILARPSRNQSQKTFTAKNAKVANNLGSDFPLYRGNFLWVALFNFVTFVRFVVMTSLLEWYISDEPLPEICASREYFQG